MPEEPLRCPEEGCTGWVSFVDDDEEAFWGCGECGTVWDDREELDDAIRDIIAEYPYRKKVYRKTKSGFQPVPLEKEPGDYEEQVEAELGEEDDDECGLACPVSQCDATIIHSPEDEDDPERWFCDCCDSTWLDKQNLLKEIDAMVAKYPYRAKMYEKVDGEWQPVE